MRVVLRQHFQPGVFEIEGDGKTESVVVFTRYLAGDDWSDDRLFRFDLSEYQTQETLGLLLGASSDETGMLGMRAQRQAAFRRSCSYGGVGLLSGFCWPQRLAGINTYEGHPTAGWLEASSFFCKKFQEKRRLSVMPCDPPHMPMSEPPKETPQAWLLAALARFERPLVRYAFGLCGDLEQARDAVQDTFIKLSRDPARAATPATHDSIEGLAPWLFTVCKNRVIDFHRKNSRLVPMDTTLLEQAPAATPAPDTALDGKDTARQLRALIAELPEKQRHLLKLKFETGLSYKEIASATGLTTSNIGWLIHQAVQSLRASWAATQ